MTDNGKNAAPVRRSVFREGIREHLIEDILSGRLKPGARIVETRVAQQLGVSQGPVREALRDLELFGFVVSAPFRGTQVRKLSTDDLVEMYPVRAALEGIAARLAVARLQPETLAELEGLIDTMREAAEHGDQGRHVRADFEFHHVIVKASGNRMLEQVWLTMRLATTTFVTHSMHQITHRTLSDIGERHVAVLEALRTRDPDIAEAAMRHHIEEPGDWIRAAAERDRTHAALEAEAAAGEVVG